MATSGSRPQKVAANLKAAAKSCRESKNINTHIYIYLSKKTLFIRSLLKKKSDSRQFHVFPFFILLREGGPPVFQLAKKILC